MTTLKICASLFPANFVTKEINLESNFILGVISKALGMEYVY
jgi:hypothetical protein